MRPPAPGAAWLRRPRRAHIGHPDFVKALCWTVAQTTSSCSDAYAAESSAGTVRKTCWARGLARYRAQAATHFADQAVPAARSAGGTRRRVWPSLA